MPTDHRLIKDYIPLEAISAGARREKVRSQGAHLHPAHPVGAAAPGRLPRYRLCQSYRVEQHWEDQNGN